MKVWELIDLLNTLEDREMEVGVYDWEMMKYDNTQPQVINMSSLPSEDFSKVTYDTDNEEGAPKIPVLILNTI